MDWLVKLLCFSVFLCGVSAQWNDPFIHDPENEYVEFKPEGEIFRINIHEEQLDLHIGTLEYIGEASDVQMSSQGNVHVSLNLVAECDSTTNCKLVVKNGMDFEQNLPSSYRVDVKIGSIEKFLIIVVVNIDDNPTFMQLDGAEGCKVDEETKGITDCKYTLNDADGWLASTTFKLVEYDDVFEFKLTNPNVGENEKTASVDLYVIADEFLYEKRSLYISNLVLSEGSKSEFNFRVLIEVTDIPNNPPVWAEVRSMYQISEELEATITIKAVDGDINIQDPVDYKIVSLDQQWASFIKIEDPAEGAIKISPINRDVPYFDDTSVISFQLIAYERHDPSWETVPWDVTLIVDDIDDEIPEIILTGGNPSPNIFKICERRTNTIPDLILTINDKDLGENARYTAELEENMYTEAFKIVPDNGYQLLTFLLTIDNGELLDYEKEEWRSFTFKIKSKGTIGNNADETTIEFELINWNDEPPVFTQSSYTVNVEETVGAGEVISTVEASDPDGYDITYSLPEGMASILEITDVGEIKTKVDKVLDYERQQVLLLYITATDKFDEDQGDCNPVSGNPPNSVTVIVTVNVVDVNDETPVLNAIINEDIIIPENLPDGTLVDTGTNVIEATDADKDAILQFDIDWDSSWATKSGTRLNDNDFDTNVRGFLKVETDSTTQGKSLPVFNTVEKDPENPGHSPDYEKFHAVVLRLKVTDTDQTVPGVPNFATADINIFIGDENDNAPIFDAIQDRSVIENAADGTTLGRVSATDADGEGNNKITYSLQSVGDPGKDKAEINADSGELTVMNKDPPNTNIDCDNPPIQFLEYEVTATDPHGLSAIVTVKINIIDMNDVPPVLTLDSAAAINEEIVDGVVQTTISAEDGDRDAPNNEVVFSITNRDATFYFKIDENTGEISTNGAIDREDLPSNPIVVNIQAMDNKGITGLTDSGTISITITDINDNAPEIRTEQLPATENNGPGEAGNEIIGTITIHDNDLGGTPNSKVTLKILTVTHNEEELDDYFDVTAPVQNGQDSTSNLIATKSLEGYHGTIDIQLEAQDEGEPNMVSEPADSKLILEVSKFNFKDPAFIFPILVDKPIYLNLAEANTPAELVIGRELDAIEAEDQQGGKYQVELNILDPASTPGNEIEQEIFMFANGGSTATSPAKLRIKTKPNPNEEYHVKIIATNKDGIPARSIEKTVTFIFINSDAQPQFIKQDDIRPIFENDADVIIEGLPEAAYAGEDNPLRIFYHIQDPTSVPFVLKTIEGNEKYYGVGINTDLHPEGLDREAENGEQYIVKIIAARTENPPAIPDPAAILTLTITITDINDNDPIFNVGMYYAAILNTRVITDIIFEVKAIDLDPTDSVIYSFTKIEGHGAVANVGDPFAIGETTGIITLNFPVTTVMDGYFEIDLRATDVLDGGGNTGDTKAQVYVVSDLHRMDFKFDNTIDEVNNLKEEIKRILKEIFEFESIWDGSNIVDEDGKQLAVVFIHFIDLDEYMPVLKETIIEIASVVTVLSKLKGEMSSIGLTLESFVDNLIFPEDLSEYYKTWLIGVAAVMGVLIAFMIIAFTFKYMGMKKQISRLTGRKFGSMDSGLNRIAAPNTNNKAFDGANPMFATGEKTEMPPDNISVSSGDSELYGVENNPVFSNDVEKY